MVPRPTISLTKSLREISETKPQVVALFILRGMIARQQ